MAPMPVATPRPPWKPRKTERQAPTTAATPARARTTSGAWKYMAMSTDGRALAAVEEGDRQAQLPAHRAQGVGAARPAAADLAGIDAAGEPGHDDAGRDGADEVGDEQDQAVSEQLPIHAARIAPCHAGVIRWCEACRHASSVPTSHVPCRPRRRRPGAPDPGPRPPRQRPTGPHRGHLGRLQPLPAAGCLRGCSSRPSDPLAKGLLTLGIAAGIVIAGGLLGWLALSGHAATWPARRHRAHRPRCHRGRGARRPAALRRRAPGRLAGLGCRRAPGSRRRRRRRLRDAAHRPARDLAGAGQRGPGHRRCPPNPPASSPTSRPVGRRARSHGAASSGAACWWSAAPRSPAPSCRSSPRSWPGRVRAAARRRRRSTLAASVPRRRRPRCPTSTPSTRTWGRPWSTGRPGPWPSTASWTGPPASTWPSCSRCPTRRPTGRWSASRPTSSVATT